MNIKLELPPPPEIHATFQLNNNKSWTGITADIFETFLKTCQTRQDSLACLVILKAVAHEEKKRRKAALKGQVALAWFS